MVKVCVVGGGSAGQAAARRAGEDGAEVVLFEKSNELPDLRLRRCALVRGHSDQCLNHAPRTNLGQIDVRVGSEVKSVSGGRVVLRDGSESSFDSLVLATGSRPVSTNQPHTPGIHLLGGEDAYNELRRLEPSASNIVVLGSGALAFQAAEFLRGGGAGVTILPGPVSPGDSLNSRVLAVLADAATAFDVHAEDLSYQKAFGVGRVEAVLAGGKVLPCDLLVCITLNVPFLPRVSSACGSDGGILVNSALQSSDAGTYGAGSCAEQWVGAPGYRRSLALAPEATGRVAGYNSAGHSLIFRPLLTRDLRIFDLRLVRAGLSLREALASGFEAVEVGSRSSRSACSIIFERPTSKVLGLEMIGTPASVSPEAAVLAVSESVSLSALAACGYDSSTDISPVAEAARQGFSHDQGAHLRPRRSRQARPR